MTTREWFRAWRAADWERDSALVSALIAIADAPDSRPGEPLPTFPVTSLPYSLRGCFSKYDLWIALYHARFVLPEGMLVSTYPFWAAKRRRGNTDITA